ncbi:MAG: hypothetical protein IPJ65_30325 [Archangiaceae bacterium]|nr:hypothetical protein [Archangiaceae bacterium]
MAALLAAGGAYALASWNWCPRATGSVPRVVSRLRSPGPVQAGAAAVEIAVPTPIVAAGYGPRRPELSKSALPLKARAVVLKAGEVSFGLVAIDLLLVPDDVASAVRSASGLSDCWVVATHSHSSFGGYDRRLVAQLAGTGRFREDARAAVVEAAVRALRAAAASVQAVEISTGEGSAELAVARSGEASDPKVRRVKFGSLGQWLLLAAHPTLVPRPAAALDPDYPGRVSERADAGVTLVLQSAGANARAVGEGPEDEASRVLAALDAVALAPLEASGLSVTRVEVELPSTDASRLVPRLFAMPGRNFLCGSAPRVAEVGVLKLGAFELAAVPAEVSAGAAQSLGVPLVSLANGYAGYVEPAEVVDRGEGESKRQYFSRELLEAFRAGLTAAR